MANSLANSILYIVKMRQKRAKLVVFNNFVRLKISALRVERWDSNATSSNLVLTAEEKLTVRFLFFVFTRRGNAMSLKLDY